MYHLVYYSSATRAFDDLALTELLIKSRGNNNVANVTGMLLYKDGNFMQILEGEEAVVHKLYQTIEQDSRHKDIVVVINEPVADREFSDWSMAFRNLNDQAVINLPGFNRFMNCPLTADSFNQSPSICMDLLYFFKHS